MPGVGGITKNYVSMNNNILTKFLCFASISTMIFGISFFTFAFFSFFAFYFFGKRCVVRKAYNVENTADTKSGSIFSGRTAFFFAEVL